jgi:transcription antitermination factor NusG
MSNLAVQIEINRGGWHVLKVLHQNEFAISNLLNKRFGIKATVPAIKVWKRTGRGKVSVIKPLLTSYVFLPVGHKLLESNILFSFKGVIGFLRNNGNLSVVPHDQLMSLEKLADSPYPVFEQPYSKIKPGERVCVVQGPLKGALGHFERNGSGPGLFVVSLDLFRRSVVTELESDFIEPY